MKQIVVLNDTDNVATSLVPLEAQSRIEVELNGESRYVRMHGRARRCPPMPGRCPPMPGRYPGDARPP